MANATKSEFPLRASEVAAVALAVGMVAVHLAMFALRPDRWHWSIFLAIPLGLLGADFLSGLIHWAGDTWGDDDSPGIGMRFLRPFRFHHSHPTDLLRSNFFTTNGDTALATLPILGLPFLLPCGSFGAVWLVAVGAFGMWTSQFHRWAHQKAPPRPVAWLQRRGLILGRDHHLRHHKPPYTRNYCIATGWCDGVLGAIRFFPALEWPIVAMFGCRPRGEPNGDPTASPRTANHMTVRDFKETQSTGGLSTPNRP